MTKLIDLFDKPSLADWVTLLKKELKDEPFEKLLRTDDLEGITFETFQHADSVVSSSEQPGTFPFTRGYSNEIETWKNGFYISVSDEKRANSKALDVLMKGADHLVFDLRNKLECNLEQLLHTIQVEYITLDLILSNFSQLEKIDNYFNGKIPASIRTSIGAETIVASNLSDYSAVLTKCKSPVISINAFELQQCGASVSEEIAYALMAGHSVLYEILQIGIPLNHATKLIQFKFGTGATYFYEIAKYRVFRKLWTSIINAYKPATKEEYYTIISAVSGSMNKSLKDPYTNLLRQTTETMSAIIGGVDNILVLPYDQHSIHGASSLAERMALNISLILKEESFLDKVKDALGGSYALEKLTDLFAEKSWNLFCELEKGGGLFSSASLEHLQKTVELTAIKKADAIQSGRKVVIGINKYPNPDQIHVEQKPGTLFHGISKLSYEHLTMSTLSSK